MTGYRIEDAISALVELVEPALMDALIHLTTQQKAGWFKDPEVQGTFGILKLDDLTGRPTNRALVVVYSPDLPWMNGKWDFEEDGTLIAEMMQEVVA